MKARMKKNSGEVENMKRYRFYNEECLSDCEMATHPDGEWVKYEDVLVLLHDIKTRILYPKIEIHYTVEEVKRMERLRSCEIINEARK